MADIKKIALLIATSLAELTREELETLLIELKETYGLKPTQPEVIEIINSIVPEEKAYVKISLDDVGTKKLQLVKVWNHLTNLDLTDSKKVIDSTPVILKENISKEEAQMIKNEFETVSPGVILTII